MKTYQPDSETVEQLHGLGYVGAIDEDAAHSHDKPLLICDVDEVVLHLVDPFVQVLEERGYVLKDHSFRLTGNVFDARSGREATQEEVWAGLTQLFEEQAKRQAIVDGVVDNLVALADRIDVVFLTNMPHEFRDIRRQHLASHGLDFPLITNTRSKVPAIQTLFDHCAHPVGFIDDTPKNLEQVRDSVEGVHLFHFMANERFRELAGDIEGVDFSTGDWAHAHTHIRDTLTTG
ncbi:MAG: hypothetical protein HRU27_12685 [Rhizobiaceae bacterium]|nr:hypothetical protein [Hyphomicrobiales bacterium]NRB31440.1 hypothetical protein [Rhizobiaceae bacterium]